MTRTGIALCLALCLSPAAAGAQGESPESAATGELERALDEQLGADEEARVSQQRIDRLDDETQKLLSEYRRALTDAESYATYADQLAMQVRSQAEEMEEIDRQLREIETTSREISPLMQRMLDTLGEFVALDVPFLLEERTRRVATLRDMMTRADVTISEKYRRIVEAYEGTLGEGAGARTVQFLRVGRVSLLYQTMDGRETGYWDVQQKGWVVDGAYRHAFKEGIAVAKKLRAPEMLVVPVPAPKEASS